MTGGIDGVVDWLLLDGRLIAAGTVCVTELADRLRAIALPLVRVSHNLPTLHPQEVFALPSRLDLASSPAA